MRKIFIFCLLTIIVPHPVFSSQTPERFIDNGNGTVTDTAKGLMWIKDPNFLGRRCNENRDDPVCGLLLNREMPFMSWKKAQMAVKFIFFSGYDDWRLPSKEEAEVLKRIHRNELKNLFGNLLEMYWTSSPGKKEKTFLMIFPNNEIIAPVKEDTLGFVWPVRDINKN